MVRAVLERTALSTSSSSSADLSSHVFSIMLQGGDGLANNEHSHPCLPRYIEKVDFGQYELATWYHSPLPPPYATAKHLFICPYTLKYFRKRKTLDSHMQSIALDHRHPPGECIYVSPAPAPANAASDTGPKITAVCQPQVREPLVVSARCVWSVWRGTKTQLQVSVYKIDGLKHKLFCQNLCLFSRMFLDGKTLIWEVWSKILYRPASI